MQRSIPTRCHFDSFFLLHSALDVCISLLHYWSRSATSSISIWPSSVRHWEPFLDVLQWLLSMPKGWPPITARQPCTGSAAHAQKPQDTNTSSKRRICGRKPLSCNAMMCCNGSCQCPGADYISQQHADSACTEATTWHHQHCMAHLAHSMLCLRLWPMHKTLHEAPYLFCTVVSCVSKRWNAAFWVHCACSVNLKHIQAWCHVPVYELGPRTHPIMIQSLSSWCCAHHAWRLWNHIHIQISKAERWLHCTDHLQHVVMVDSWHYTFAVFTFVNIT